MKTQFHSIWKILNNQIILCVLIVSGFFLLILIFEQKVSEANESPESAIVSLKTHNKLKEAMELVDEYINSCSTNEAYSWGYNEKGGIFTLMGEYTKAIEYLEKALSVIQLRLGNDHPYTKILKTNISLAKEEKPE